MLDLTPVARAVVGGSLAVKRGEKVWVHGWDHTTDLMSKLAMECRRVGAEVLLTVEPEELWLHSLLSSPLESLEKLSRYQIFFTGAGSSLRAPCPRQRAEERTTTRGL